ncbi:hypothetical protein M407DRAFT_31968 [Tulasnella calospora MUT 4182]|uniref:NADH:ubiquinone reductase (non-electrogenic) n=1 Tax=Tulasnella calospora MUT 4182 TaxID=1051891 RepID=A0A0C3LAC1_9AGAM|nr:hypothetical protein M407DRAFT_31968 [Tulasnella calospora MUT 4182]
MQRSNNVVLIRPQNYFHFAPLLPSMAVGTLEPRSSNPPDPLPANYEAEAQKVDTHTKQVTIADLSNIKGDVNNMTILYDILVYAVGAETQTFGIPGVKELHDFIKDDLRSWYPELADKLKITLVEALPNVLPMFSRELIQFTESTLKEQNIEVLDQDHDRGIAVWSAGVGRGQCEQADYEGFDGPTAAESDQQLVDDCLRLLGVNDVYAIGDFTATSYTATAQVATQQGRYLARLLGQIAKKEELETKLAELRGERSGLPEGPEG